jgi:hypothetical protein
MRGRRLLRTRTRRSARSARTASAPRPGESPTGSGLPTQTGSRFRDEAHEIVAAGQAGQLRVRRAGSTGSRLDGGSLGGRPEFASWPAAMASNLCRRETQRGRGEDGSPEAQSATEAETAGTIVDSRRRGEQQAGGRVSREGRSAKCAGCITVRRAPRTEADTRRPDGGARSRPGPPPSAPGGLDLPGLRSAARSPTELARHGLEVETHRRSPPGLEARAAVTPVISHPATACQSFRIWAIAAHARSHPRGRMIGRTRWRHLSSR